MQSRVKLFATLLAMPLWITGCGGGGDGDTVTPVTPAGTVNSAPSIAGTPPSTVTVGGSYSFLPAASDPDGDTLTFSIANKPAWTAFSAETGALLGVPRAGDEGTYSDITISVSDGAMSSSMATFSLTVRGAGANVAPLIAGTPPSSVSVGGNYSFQPDVFDANGDTLTFSVQNLPAWAVFDTRTGTISGSPLPGDEGTSSGIIIAVTDGEFTTSFAPFSITVNAEGTNNPPAISGKPPQAVAVGASYAFEPTASDPDSDTLVFTVLNRPGWASFDTSTGMLSGSPQSGDEGSTDDITISVSDGQVGSSLAPFSITVLPAGGTNTAPQISGNPAISAAVGESYSFTPSAFDADGDTLTFGIANLPVWASFSVATGTLSGTPQSKDEGDYPNILISVSDGTSETALGAFAIVVFVSNSAPTISGSPNAEVTVGSTYTFAPSASDPDGDDLVYSIENMPSWATFSDTTGSIQGIPEESDVGAYANIVISVSDGQESASLPPFSVEVTQIATGSVTFSWNPPTQNEDGSALTDLAGYTFFYGAAPGDYAEEIEVRNPNISSYMFDNLTPGIYYFSAKSFNDNGVSSAFAEEAAVEIVAD